MSAKGRRQQLPALGVDGAVALIVTALAIIAVLVWAITVGWPTMLIVLGLGLATLIVKSHRRALGWATVIAFVGMLIVAAVHGPTPTPAAATGPTASVTAMAAPTPEPPVDPAPAPSPPPVAVKRVIDGDTFELTDGVRVRVLGINSCEMDTKGGQEAKEYAEYWLFGNDVTLRTEPTAPDKDRYGRLLRYVTAKDADLGVSMIYQEHTSVYQGKNDASPDYVAELRDKDDGPLYCAGVAAYVSRGSHYVPVPNNDDDGESRFCRKRRWC